MKRTLTFHHALVADLKLAYRRTKRERERQLCARLLTGKVVKKYKMQQTAQTTFGFSQKRWGRYSGAKSGSKGLMTYQRSWKASAAGEEMKKSILNFFTQDDNSRLMPGKKDTKTKYKKKMQKRLLSDTILNLHRKYLAENPHRRCSYSLFCSLRPFWVMHPTLEDRQTCLCKSHENFSFMVQKLHQLKILPHTDIEKFADKISCDTKAKMCMYGDCMTCKNNIITLDDVAYAQEDTVRYKQWQTSMKEVYEEQTSEEQPRAVP